MVTPDYPSPISARQRQCLLWLAMLNLGGGQPALGYIMPVMTWHRVKTGVCSRAAEICMVKIEREMSIQVGPF